RPRATARPDSGHFGHPPALCSPEPPGRRACPTRRLRRLAPHCHCAEGGSVAGTLEPVAVLGLGAMGRRMAHRALQAGIPTIVWNRHREATRELAEAGAKVADTAAD